MRPICLVKKEKSSGHADDFGIQYPQPIFHPAGANPHCPALQLRGAL